MSTHPSFFVEFNRDPANRPILLGPEPARQVKGRLARIKKLVKYRNHLTFFVVLFVLAVVVANFRGSDSPEELKAYLQQVDLYDQEFDMPVAEVRETFQTAFPSEEIDPAEAAKSLRKMVEVVASVQAKVKTMDVPSAARAHHRLLLEQLDLLKAMNEESQVSFDIMLYTAHSEDYNQEEYETRTEANINAINELYSKSKSLEEAVSQERARLEKEHGLSAPDKGAGSRP